MSVEADVRQATMCEPSRAAFQERETLFLLVVSYLGVLEGICKPVTESRRNLEMGSHWKVKSFTITNRFRHVPTARDRTPCFLYPLFIFPLPPCAFRSELSFALPITRNLSCPLWTFWLFVQTLFFSINQGWTYRVYTVPDHKWQSRWPSRLKTLQDPVSWLALLWKLLQSLPAVLPPANDGEDHVCFQAAFLQLSSMMMFCPLNFTLEKCFHLKKIICFAFSYSRCFVWYVIIIQWKDAWNQISLLCPVPHPLPVSAQVVNRADSLVFCLYTPVFMFMRI